jgi:S1-C subfamily serine protease
VTCQYDGRDERIEEAFFGTAGQPVLVAYLDETARRMRVEVVVVAVPAGSQAQRVGVRSGDVLLRYDGSEVRSALTFYAAQGKTRVVPLLVRRGEQTIEFGLVPGSGGW